MEGQHPRWIRAVRALKDARIRAFRPGEAPAIGDPYVWVVMDRNSQYAVGLTVDRDGDGVPMRNQCPTTAIGQLVDANGCSVADYCPCEGSRRNHGAYVRCGAQTGGRFVSTGLMTERDKGALVSAGARSSCGF